MNNLETLCKKTLCKKKSLAIIILRRMKVEWQKNALFLPSSATGTCTGMSLKFQVAG